MRAVERRRGMGGKAEELSYISDGLVFHLDGIDKGDTAGAWTDLINGTVFTGTAVAQSDSFFFENTYLSNSSFVLPANTDHTVELCYVETVSQNGVLFCSGNNAKGNIFVAPYFTMYMQSFNMYKHDRVINRKYTISFNGERCIQNGSSKAYQRVGSNYTNGRTNIGARYYGGNYQLFFRGNVYAIRVYNKTLTEAEIRNNQKVDNKRFKLGLSL